MIGILNYGLGNLNAFQNAFKFLNKPCKIIQKPNEFNEISHLILPGVGSFDLAIQYLNKHSLIDSLNNFAIVCQKPVLGVCLGMQILGNMSEEGKEDGLGWIPGSIKRLKNEFNDSNFRLPHMGWNEVSIKNSAGLFSSIQNNSEFYFLHQYFYELENDSNCLSTSTYGASFTSAICLGNIFGVQFHPEKSHSNGLKLLKNFSEV